MRKSLLSLLAATLLATVGVTCSPATATAGETCADVVFIGLRGSGETKGTMGPTVTKAWSAFHESATTLGLSAWEKNVDYDAVAVGDLLDRQYWTSLHNSVNGGIGLLRQAVEEAADPACPQQKIVLVGYSQGAWVIKDFLTTTGNKTRFKGILLFGDASLDPRDRFLYPRPRRKGHFPGGIAVVIKTPEWLKYGRSYCAHGDPVCHGYGVSVQPHFGYVNADAAEGGEWLANLFAPKPFIPPPPIPTPAPAPAPPAAPIRIDDVHTTDPAGNRKDVFNCKDPINYRYDVTSAFPGVERVGFSVYSLGHEVLPDAVRKVDLQPGLSRFYSPDRIPYGVYGAQPYTITVTTLQGQWSAHGSFTVNCAG